MALGCSLPEHWGAAVLLVPKEKQIRGVFTAVEMPVVFFDHTTRFEGDKMDSRR